MFPKAGCGIMLTRRSRFIFVARHASASPFSSCLGHASTGGESIPRSWSSGRCASGQIKGSKGVPVFSLSHFVGLFQVFPFLCPASKYAVLRDPFLTPFRDSERDYGGREWILLMNPSRGRDAFAFPLSRLRACFKIRRGPVF